MLEEKKIESFLWFSCGAGWGVLRPKRKIGFVLMMDHMFCYHAGSIHQEPCRNARLGHRCERGAAALNHLSSRTAGVKGEAIYINYWRAVNIISWYHIKINLIKPDIKRQDDLLLAEDTIKEGA